MARALSSGPVVVNLISNMYTDFIDNSNQRNKQLIRIKNMTDLKNTFEDKIVCENHLTSYWNPKYKRCAAGFRLNEDCKQLVESEVKNDR